MKFRLIKVLLGFLPGKSTSTWREVSQCLPNRATVILVAGFAAGRRTLSIIRKRLEHDGYNVVVLAMDWNSISESFLGLYPMAAKLSSVVLKLKKELGMERSKIYLVAHSAGGLVARYYVQRLGGYHYCEGLITLGTPHRGTWKGLLGLFSHLILKARVLFQLTPISPFIRKLNAASYPPNFRMVSIYSKDDLLCPPGVTQLPLSLAKEASVETIETRRLFHADFLKSKLVYKMIKKSLEVKARAGIAI